MAQKRENTIETLAMVLPDLHVQINELIKPTTHSMIRFCEAVLDIMDINIEQIKMIIMQHMEDQDAHQDLLDNYVLYRCMKSILNYLKLNVFKYPFTISDVLSPTAKQFSFVAMMISNTLLYTNDQMDIMNLIQKQVEDGVQEIEKMHKDNNELTTEANIQAILLSDLKKNVEKIEIELQDTIEVYKKERHVYENTIEGYEMSRKENIELEAEEAALIEVLCKEKAQSNELKHLLVDDCDVITAELERLEKELANEQSYETDYAMNLYVKNDAELKYRTYVTTVDTFLEQKPAKWLLEMYEAQNLKKVSVVELKEQLQHLSTVQNDVQSTIPKLQAKFNLIEEEQQAVQVQMEAKQVILEQEIMLLQEECDTNAANLKKLNEEIQLNENYCLQYEQTKSRLDKFHEKMYKKLRDETEILRNQVDRQFEDLQLCSEQIKCS